MLDQNNNHFLIASHENLKHNVAEEVPKIFRILKFEKIITNESKLSKMHYKHLSIDQRFTFQWKDQRNQIKKLNKLKAEREILLADKEF